MIFIVYIFTHFSRLADPQPLQHNVSNYPLMTDPDSGSVTSSQLSDLSESEVGPEVTHIYQIENKGPSDILEAQVRTIK